MTPLLRLLCVDAPCREGAEVSCDAAPAAVLLPRLVMAEPNAHRVRYNEGGQHVAARAI